MKSGTSTEGDLNISQPASGRTVVLVASPLAAEKLSELKGVPRKEIHSCGVPADHTVGACFGVGVKDSQKETTHSWISPFETSPENCFHCEEFGHGEKVWGGGEG